MAEYRTLVEVAASLQVSPRWLRELVRNEKIPVLRRGRIIRFDAVALRALEDAMRAAPAASRPATTLYVQGRLPMDPAAAYAKVLKLTSRPARAKDISAQVDALLAPKKRPARSARGRRK